MENVFLDLEQRLLPGAGTAREDLEELLDEDFQEIGSSGVVHDRQSVVTALVAEQSAGWWITNFQAKPLSDDVVLVTYVAMRRGGGSSLRSSIWKRTGARWRMTFHQGTKMTSG